MIVASAVKVRNLKWLWYPYIPDHAASLIFGPGKMGKSHITVDLAARFSTGDVLPGEDGKTPHPPMRVLMLSAEDEYDTVLVPRLIEAGADLSRIAFPPIPFTLDELGLQRLARYIHEFGAKVVFIDPIVHYMGAKVDMFRSNEVREVIGGIHQLAIKTQTAIIIVGHTRKGGEGEDYEKAMGSVDFINAVRSVMMTAKTNDGTRVLRHVNTNYAKTGDSIPYEFGDSGFVWGEPFPEGGDKIKDPDEASKLAKPRIKAVSFLKFLLKDGPVPAKEVEERAKDEGIPVRTLARAKNGVAESYAERLNGKMSWFWRLKGDERKANGSEVHSLEEQGRAEDQKSSRGRHMDGELHGEAAVEAGGTVPKVADDGRFEATRSRLSAEARAFLADRGE